MVDMSKWQAIAKENIANRPATTGRLAGKIAIVTGAAQGFGRGIAEEMYREGCIVGIADMNLPGAQAVADELGEYASLTVAEYNGIIRDGTNETSKTALQTADGLCYYDYTADVDGDSFTYRVFAFKGSDAFWLVQIAVLTEDAESLEADIMAWAKSFTPS